MLMPLPFILGFVAGLVSLAVFGAGVWVIWSWWTGALQSMWWLVSGVVALAWSLFGRSVVLAFYPRGRTDDRPFEHGGAHESLAAPDGSRLHIETEGVEDGPAILLTHGWALDSRAWRSVRQALAKRHRVVLWDLPGLGRSTQPADGRYTVERLAEDLRAVLGTQAPDRPVTLVGHSIGGMMMLTLCRRFPELLGRQVTGLVLIDTTHRWPLLTVTAGRLLRILRWPLIEPLLHLTIWLWPLFWAMNWMSYLNGTSHLVNRLTSLSGRVTREQLDFAARFNAIDKPSVVAKGLLAVMRWDETATPAQVVVPARVIVGDEDRLTLPASARELSSILRNADFVEITAGHNGIIERGPEYAEAIAQAAERFRRTAAQAAV